MKPTYLIIIVIIAVTCLFYFASCSHRPDRQGKNDTEDTIQPKVRHLSQNIYPDLRMQALYVTPDILKLSLPKNKVIVYGVIMDWEMGGATATTVSYMTGDASLYLSSGGGVIGGGQHENVNRASKEFTQLAQTFLEKARKIDSPALPAANEVQFILLTNKGFYVGKDAMANFEDNSSPWMKLFEEGNKLLSELHNVSGDK
jgi:hypothetical protein